MTGARRLLVVAVIPAVLMALIVLWQLASADRMPDPHAVHWGPGGSPNGSMPPAASLVLLGGAVAWAVLAGSGDLIRRSGREPGVEPAA